MEKLAQPHTNITVMPTDVLQTLLYMNKQTNELLLKRIDALEAKVMALEEGYKSNSSTSLLTGGTVTVKDHHIHRIIRPCHRSIDRWSLTPETLIVEQISKEEAKQKVIEFIEKNKTSDIAELHREIKCDIETLIDVVDELKKEGRISE